MLLDNSSDIKRIVLGYQFHFGVGIPYDLIIHDCNDNHPCSLRDIGKCCYRIARGNISFCPESDRTVVDTMHIDDFISTYKKNTDRRIKSSFKNIRDTLVIKMDDMPISKLKIDNESINIALDQNVKLTGLISIQILGVCTVSFWIEGYKPANETIWRNACDPALISFTLVYANITKLTWKLIDLVKYVSLKCHNIVNSSIAIPDNIENNIILFNEKKYLDFLIKQYKKSKNKPISYSIVSYPIFCIQYNINSGILNNIFADSKSISDLRLVLYRDSHWQLKTDDIINQ
jgi:hypothetical protein